MTTEKPPISLAELIRRVGDDNIRIEPIDANVQGARLVSGGRLTELRILTSMTNPNQIMGLAEGVPLPSIGLVIWFPRHLSDRARMEYDEAAAAPSEADKLAAEVKRAGKLEDLVHTLLAAAVMRTGTGSLCLHCHRAATNHNPRIDHKDGCIVKTAIIALGALRG